MQLKAVLVDDEKPARDELTYLVGRLENIEIVAQAGNGVEALDTIAKVRPDLVFLDIQMPGLSGFEVARRLMTSGDTPELIFVTAFDRHAIEAFEVNAVDYLLKPVDPARLDGAVQRARRRLTSEHARPDSDAGEVADSSPQPGAPPSLSREQLERIAQLVAERQHRRDQLAIRVGERFVLVQAEDIIYASMSDEVITVATARLVGASNYRTLDELQARLNPDVFWRVHRAHLVNINKIREIVPWFSRNYLLRMKDANSTEIPVSRAQTRRLREYLKL